MVVIRHSSGKYLCYNSFTAAHYWGSKKNSEKFYYNGKTLRYMLEELGPFVSTRWA